jgi:hypothetical protein
MNILSISVLAVVTVIICVMLKPKNAEISVMLGISCSVIILIGVLTQVSANLGTSGKSLREIFLQRQLSAAVNLFSFCSASIF